MEPNNGAPQNAYFLSGGTFFTEIKITLHFKGLSDSCHMLCHSTSYSVNLLNLDTVLLIRNNTIPVHKGINGKV